MKNPQVRERDYFFIGSFFIIMLWGGMGTYFLLDLLKRFLGNNGSKSTLFVIALAGTVFLTFPFDALRNQYFSHNRSKDTFAHNYAYNILISCDPDAILFTNGDNDTFPLWFLQEVKEIRKDVRIVNLSLLNTNWYIKQLRDYEPKLDMKNTDDDYIDNVLCGRTRNAIMRRLWPEPKEVTLAGITWTMSATTQTNFIRIQDEMVARIIRWNNWKRPVYFAVTVARQNMINLDDYLRMEGMVYRLLPSKEIVKDNMEILYKNFMERYKYGDIAKPKVYKSPNTTKLSVNYLIGFFQLTDALVKAGQIDQAMHVIKTSQQNVPMDITQHLYIAALLHQNKRTKETGEQMENILSLIDTNNVEEVLKLADSITMPRYSMEEIAIPVYQHALKLSPGRVEAYEGIANIAKIQLQRNNLAGALRTTKLLTEIAPEYEEGQRLHKYLINQAVQLQARQDSLRRIQQNPAQQESLKQGK